MEAKNNRYDLIILFSGGADSIVLYDLAKSLRKNPLYLLIDYEQLHNEELEYARNFLREQNAIQHSQTIKIQNLKINSGLTGNGKKELYDNVNSFYVPSRNMIFISLASCIAEANKIKKIWYGADFTDRLDLFPDCYQDWVIKMNELLKINSTYDIQLECPLIGFPKNLILEYLKQKNYNLNDIFSGYGNLEK